MIGFSSRPVVVKPELNGLAYAHGAGYNTTKQCLPGTRREILTQVESWARTTDPNVPRVLWINGAAGTGKSAIAHTIALRFDQNRELGSFLCFDRTYIAERRHEKVFSTIARDLASHDPGIRRAVADTIRARNWLKHTTDIVQQWEHLLVKPSVQFSTGLPILLVIDALDESGNAQSRSHLLPILAHRAEELPSNFRILLTSRPEDDISQALRSSVHVMSIDMNNIHKSSINHDISIYISTRLAHFDHTFFDEHRLRILVDQSEGLFQWAFVACEFIQGHGRFSSPVERFNRLTHSPTAGSLRKLDSLYDTILQEICAGNDEDDMQVFWSVMGQILALFEPLSLAALMSMRKHFPSGLVGANSVISVVKHMGSLLSGITNHSVPIRPLHSSFHDYLTDCSRSKRFYIDTSLHKYDIAYSTLQIMKEELHFNMCGLETSYLLNSDVPDLAQRIKQSISSALSYSCQYWAAHVAATVFGLQLANQVRGFLHQQFLFWIEVLSLMKSVPLAAPALSAIMKWITVCPLIQF